jgi:hypothetical protein
MLKVFCIELIKFSILDTLIYLCTNTARATLYTNRNVNLTGP